MPERIGRIDSAGLMATNSEVVADPSRLWGELSDAHADRLEALRGLFTRRRAADVHHRHALEQIRRALHDDAEADVSTFPPGAQLHADVRVNPELRADLQLDVELAELTDACRQRLVELAAEMVAWVRHRHANLTGVEMDAQREAQWTTWIGQKPGRLGASPSTRG